MRTGISKATVHFLNADRPLDPVFRGHHCLYRFRKVAYLPETQDWQVASFRRISVVPNIWYPVNAALKDEIASLHAFSQVRFA